MLTLPVSHNQLVWLFRALLVVNLVAVSWLAFTGTPVPVSGVFLGDKFNHLAAFLVLAFCVDRSFPNTSFTRVKIWPLIFYGVLIEVVQSQLDHRQFSLLDMLADGVALAIYGFIREPMRRLIVPKD